ncbi:hypothetical protein BN10_480020 [Phycicoccus elongatus Lp2]|uniref:Uncharacterized protein n=1 Tax=Phycicoccus elongatus Lp2 TaxID=1193181 RepID=N0E2L0_9MICO|nr:hypothetical protein BN10_480020 [Phycicoccus elongatus Lp2]
MPMPGSPATSTTAPGTMPPPSTRSNSGTPVDRATARRASTSPIGTAGRSTAPAAVVRTLTAPTSLIDPQAWHSPHRPIHLLVCHPHSEHWYAAALRAEDLAAMRHTVCRGADSARSLPRAGRAVRDWGHGPHQDRQDRADPHRGSQCRGSRRVTAPRPHGAAVVRAVGAGDRQGPG